MSDFCTSGKVKTRKVHTCEMCTIKIPIGTKVEVQSGCFEGQMYRYYLCDVCTEFIHNNRQNIDFEDGLDYIYDMMREQFEDEKCRKCKNWCNDAGECDIFPYPEKHCRCDNFKEATQ